MQKQIIQIVMDSFGAQLYGKAMDCLKVLREQCIQVHLFYCYKRIELSDDYLNINVVVNNDMVGVVTEYEYMYMVVI